MKMKIDIYNLNYLKFSLLFFAVSFSLGLAINSISFGFLVVVMLVNVIKDKSYKKHEISKYTKLLLVFISVLIVIEAVNNFYVLGHFVIHKAIAFLVLPILIDFNKDRIKGIINSVLFAFILGCVFNALVNWGYAFYRGVYLMVEGINYWYFSYDFFAAPFSIQPIYLAMYYVSALVFINFIRINKYLYIFSVSVLFLSTFMLAARNSILTMLLFIPILILIKQRLKLKQLGVLIILLITTGILVFQNPIVKNRLFKVMEKGNFYSGHSLRIQIWSCALELGKNNILGLGADKTEKLLIQEFKKKKLIVPVKEKYNAHSQYLQTLAQHGIVGVGFLLFIFAYLGVKFKSQRNYLGLVWLALIIISAVTESIFVRQWGSFFFVFISMILILKTERSDACN